jgi:hypothetical protein
VYALRRAAKNDLSLEVRGSKILEETNAEGTTRTVTFAAADILEAEADGLPLDLRANGERRFHRLALGGSTFRFRYEGEGTLILDDRRVAVRLTGSP